MAENKEKSGRVGYAVAVIVNALLLAAVNAHSVWRPWTRGVVTEEFLTVLWAVNLTLWVQIFGNALLIVTHPLWFRRMAEFSFALVGIVGSVVLYQVFPFDFSIIAGPWLAVVVRIGLIAGILGGIVGMVVALMRMGRDGGAQRPTAVSQ